MEKYRVTNNEASGRFEIEQNGATGFLEYKKKEGLLLLLHTEVPEAIGGKGIAQALAAHAFESAAAENRKIKNYCAFIEIYLKRHPDLLQQLAPSE